MSRTSHYDPRRDTHSTLGYPGHVQPLTGLDDPISIAHNCRISYDFSPFLRWVSTTVTPIFVPIIRTPQQFISYYTRSPRYLLDKVSVGQEEGAVTIQGHPERHNSLSFLSLRWETGLILSADA